MENLCYRLGVTCERLTSVGPGKLHGVPLNNNPTVLTPFSMSLASSEFDLAGPNLLHLAPELPPPTENRFSSAKARAFWSAACDGFELTLSSGTTVWAAWGVRMQSVTDSTTRPTQSYFSSPRILEI